MATLHEPALRLQGGVLGSHALPVSEQNVFAVLSMMFWAITLIVSVKYVTLMLRYDHRGEGGVLALLTFAMRSVKDRGVTCYGCYHLAHSRHRCFTGMRSSRPSRCFPP
jgi:K+ transporter